MTGPEHYRAAEEHLRWLNESLSGDGKLAAEIVMAVTARAQAHATLALAAATAQNIRRNGAVADVAANTWNEVLQ